MNDAKTRLKDLLSTAEQLIIDAQKVHPSSVSITSHIRGLEQGIHTLFMEVDTDLADSLYLSAKKIITEYIAKSSDASSESMCSYFEGVASGALTLFLSQSIFSFDRCSELYSLIHDDDYVDSTL